MFGVLFIAAGVAGLTIGCGEDDELDGEGTLAEVAVQPESGYPGVQFEVSLRIDPADGTDDSDYEWRVDFDDGNSHSGQGIDGSAEYAYQEIGSYLITVEALHRGDVSARETISYTVHDPIDLSVGSVRAVPRNVFVGETATVSFDLQNETDSPVLTPFSVGAYLIDTDDVTRDGLQAMLDDGELAEVGTQRVDADDDIALAGGQEINVGINADVPDVPPGDYYAVAIIDPDEELATVDPDTTVDTSPDTIRVERSDDDLPNLFVTDLEVMPDRSFPELNRFTRAFTLGNMGHVDAFEVVHDTYLQVGSPQLDDSAILVDSTEHGPVFSQQEDLVGPDEFVLNDPIVPDAGEELEVWVIVETYSDDGDVEEANVDNNLMVSDEPIVVSDDPVDGPDIAVDEFSVSPDITYLDGVLEVEGVVSNKGTEDVSSFFCGIYMGEQPHIDPQSDPQVSTINIIGLAAGDSQVIDREITIPGVHDPGTYYFYIVCDPVGAIDQPFRGNSQAIHLEPIDVTDEADIDLYVQHVDLPDSAEDGETITVEVTACVSGSNPTGTTTGELYASPGNDVDFGDDPIKTFEMPNINPGECMDRQFDVQAQCRNFEDQLSAGVFLDSEGVLPEDNTDNNRGTSDTPMQMEGQFCQCEDDEFGDNQSTLDAASIDPGSYEASLCDAGECDFFTTEIDEGDSLVVETSHDSAHGDLETTLFAPGGVTQLDQDTSEDHQQVGVFLAGDDGLNYMYRICGADPTVRNYYDLDVDVIEQPETVDVLPRDVGIPPLSSFSVGAEIDVDFRIYNLGQQPTGPFDAEIVLTQDRELGEPSDLTLAVETIESLGAGSHRDVTIPAPIAAQVDDGDYYLAVVLDPNDVLDDANPDNNVDFSREFAIETSCYDAFTPNDSFDQAASVDPGSYGNLTACGGQSDYYEICAGDATTLEASVQFAPEDGDLDIWLHDQTFETVDSSGQTGVGTETVNVDYIDGDQCYYLRVEMITTDEDAEMNYSLDVDIDDVPPEMQCDSTFEPNDAFDTASSLWAALNYDSTLDRCPADDVDYYYVMLSTGTTVDFEASIDPDNQPGTLQLQLYRPNQVPDATDETGPGQPTASIDNYQPPTTGTYWLRVSISGDEHSVTYSLDAEGLPGVDLAAENLSIGPGTYEEGDKIRYEYDLVNYGGDDVDSADYRVFLGDSALHDPGDDQLLGDFELQDIAGNETRDIEGQVNVPTGAEAGTRYVHVSVDPDDELDDVNPNNNISTTSIEIVESTDDDNGDSNGDNGE